MVLIVLYHHNNSDEKHFYQFFKFNNICMSLFVQTITVISSLATVSLWENLELL